MTEKTSNQKQAFPWRWPERLAGVYLCIFLFIAFVSPATNWLQNPNTINLEQVYQPPFQFSRLAAGNGSTTNWLGTDRLGRDVLANLVYGARTALLVSIPAMLLATIIGLTLGSLAGFWGNTGFRMRWASVIIRLIILALVIYYGFYIRQMNWVKAFQTGSVSILLELGRVLLIFVLLSAFGWFATKVGQQIGFTKQITLPLDQIILKIIEVVGAIPRLLLIMCLAAFAQPALLNIVLLATFTYWTGIARLVRGELLQVKELPFIQAARVAGLSESRILFREALPNALPPVVVAVAFGLGNLMSLEATLSFLGIGVPAEVASWGRIMSGILSNYTAWWLLVFPAAALCGTILSLQVIAQYVLKWMNPVRNQGG